MKYVAVFCSAQDLDEKYIKPAKEFARLLAENKYNLVWGGTDKGLMKIIADSVQNGGGKLYAISSKKFHHLVRKSADVIIATNTLAERKEKFLEKADAIVCLVGGVGTLDEITDIIALKRTQHHNKPIVILNTDNFYEGLKVQFQKMKDDGFLPAVPELSSIDDLLFADTPKEAIDYINKKLK